MNVHPWEKAWEDKKFKMTTIKPSVIVQRYKELFSVDDSVLDIGCGNGRNSVYLAGLGCNVDCFDIADIRWTRSIPRGLKDKINFKKSSILSYSYTAHKYKAIILARVIQYLSEGELTDLFEKIQMSLKQDGFILISFNSNGGIFNKVEIDVPKYKYSIDVIENILRKNFNEMIITIGSDQNLGVNYEGKIKSFDIFAKKII